MIRIWEWGQPVQIWDTGGNRNANTGVMIMVISKIAVPKRGSNQAAGLATIHHSQDFNDWQMVILLSVVEK
jgi:hypothetical protein